MKTSLNQCTQLYWLIHSFIYKCWKMNLWCFFLPLLNLTITQPNFGLSGHSGLWKSLQMTSMLSFTQNIWNTLSAQLFTVKQLTVAILVTSKCLNVQKAGILYIEILPFCCLVQMYRILSRAFTKFHRIECGRMKRLPSGIYPQRTEVKTTELLKFVYVCDCIFKS